VSSWLLKTRGQTDGVVDVDVVVCVDNSSSVFELSRLPRDYWHWIESLTASVNDGDHRVRSVVLFDCF